MKTYRIKLLIIAVSIMLASCKEYLDIKPKGVIIPTTVTDYEAILNNATVANPFGYSPIIVTVTDDLIDNNYIIDKNDEQAGNAYFWKSYISRITDNSPTMWADLYRCIANLNVISEGVLSASGGTEQIKKQYYAEALVSKVYCYYLLLTFFSPSYTSTTAGQDFGVPYVTTVEQGTPTPPRPSLKESFETLINDLVIAVPDLPEENVYKTRASKNAAYALLSRLYLYMHDYDNALKYADMALSSPKAAVVDYNAYIATAVLPATNVSPEEIFNRFSYSTFYYLSKDLMDRFVLKDLRFELLTTSPPNRNFNNEKYRPSLGIGWPEVYLTRAECLARKGEVADAMGIVNDQLRKKRFRPADYIPLTAGTKEEAISAILEERRRELMFRGVRWGDMKRLNDEGRMLPVKRFAKDGVTVLATLKPDRKQYTFEIPLIVQRYNPKMPLNNP